MELVPHAILLGFEVPLVVFVGLDDDGNNLGDFETVAFEAGTLHGIVGDEAHPHRLLGKGCLSGVGRFLKVLEGASLSPIRRTEKSKPAELQRVLCVI